MAYLDPEAGAMREGIQAATVAALGAATSTVAAGATPTKAEFDALRVDVLANRTKINDILTALKTADSWPDETGSQREMPCVWNC